MSKIRVQKTSQFIFSEAFEEFIREKERKNCSPETIRFYRENINRFLEFSQGEISGNVSKSMVDSYYSYLKTLHISIESIATYMRALRTVLYDFMAKNYIDEFHIALPKTSLKHKKIYSDGELEKLLKKPNMKKCSFAEYRSWVIINYIMGTGQRLSTIINIKVGDLDLYNGLVYLRHLKNRQEEVLPLTKSLVMVLEEYCKIRDGGTDDYLFCTEHGGKLTKAGITSSIQRYNRSHGVEKTSIHLLRHTFAVHWVRESGDIAILQRMLTHGDLRTTQAYLAMSCEDMQRNMAEMNPLEKLQKKHISL